MKFVWLACLLSGGLLIAAPQDPEANVNSRYTVESVIVAGDGWSTNLVSEQNRKISPGLRQQILGLIGNKLNPAALDDLAGRLRKEFQARTVTHRLTRGENPESVRVTFQVMMRPSHFDLSVPKFLYTSRRGWSGTVDGTTTVHQNAFTAGLVSDSDNLVERYTGVHARYENTHVGTDRVHLRFEFEAYHDQWNGATLAQLPFNAPPPDETSGIYRWRQNYQPTVSFVLAEPLVLTVGTSFERLQNQYPAAQTVGANAVVATLRYRMRLDDSDTRQDLDAAYSLRAATRVLDSDFVYTRQHWGGRYTLTRGRHELVEDFEAGVITGRAPLFDRFAAGNSSLLRGWNMYEIDPLGGNRIVTNSVEYRYRIFQVFYDTGAVWDSGLPAIPRHSIGVGLRQSSFFLAVAFPVRDARADPIFMVGMNY